MAALFNRSRRDTFKLELGRRGFDNRVAYELDRIGFEIYNDPHFIKTYHIHNSSANPVRSWRFELISYPPPYRFIDIPDYGIDKSAEQSEPKFQTPSGTISVALCDEALVWESPRPGKNTTTPIFPSLHFNATKVDSAHRAQILKDIKNLFICYSFDDNTPSCSRIVKGTPLPQVDLERGLFHSGEAWLSEKKSDARKHAAVSTVFYIEE